MAFYTATTTVDDLSAATPAGSDKPSELDDAIREIKTVLKAVINNSMKGNGVQRAFMWRIFSAASIATGTVNQWNRYALDTLYDPTTLTTTGGYTNSIRPIAGLYLLDFWGQSISGGAFQTRISQATGNTGAPASANSIAALVGNVANSANAGTYAVTFSRSKALWVTDGTIPISLDYICASAGSLNSAIGANGISGPYAGIVGTFMGVLP